jgi:hypothetical protein
MDHVKLPRAFSFIKVGKSRGIGRLRILLRPAQP